MINIKPGEIYNFFDDGKIKPSRRQLVIISEVIPYDQVTPGILKEWKKEKWVHPNLYSETTDYFIVGRLGDVNEYNVFVRDCHNNWFSIGYWGGALDHDGKLFEQMIRNYPEKVNAMQWTKEKPKKEGYYWHRHEGEWSSEPLPEPVEL